MSFSPLHCFKHLTPKCLIRQRFHVVFNVFFRRGHRAVTKEKVFCGPEELQVRTGLDAELKASLALEKTFNVIRV